jgi:ElaB/YqjD/DUF883 family membrane-anchored ribosome-binding protein
MMNTHERDHGPALDRIAPRVGQQLRETAGQLRETAERAGEELEARIDNVQMKFDAVRESAIDTTKEYVQTANRYVRKNPWTAIGISAGFAFLVGVLIGRRRDG